MNLADAATTLLTGMPPFLFSLVFHEYAHAVVAHRMGGWVEDWEDRRTMDPMAHLDPVGSLLFPAIGMLMGGFIFGWAKPVRWAPDPRSDHRRAGMWVSLAGPAANVLLMFVFAAVLRVVLGFGLLGGGFGHLVQRMLWFGIYINALLAVFNMIPLPPLDGSKVLAAFLDPYNARRLLSISPMLSFIAIIFLIQTPIIAIPMGLLTSLAGVLAGFGL